MMPNNYLAKSIIGKKNLRLKSLSQKVKLGIDYFYLVEMSSTKQSECFYSWQNSFVIEKFFNFSDEQLKAYKQAGKQIETKNKWPARKSQAIDQIKKKFMKLQVQQAISVDQQKLNEDWGHYLSESNLISADDNQRFKISMAKQADKQRNNMQFYVIKGYRKDAYTEDVYFYVQDETGDLKQKTLEQMKRNNLLQIVAYLESKIIGYRR